MITVRKLKLTIIGTEEERKEKYKFIRDSQYSQYRALNLAMGILTSAYIESGMDIKSDIFKQGQKSLKNSHAIFSGIECGKGIDTLSNVNQRVKKDFSTSLKNGLAKGERTFTNYKRTYPLMTRGRNLEFRYEDNNDIYIKWVNKIEFNVVLGRGKNNHELMHTLNKIVNKEYKVGQSSFEFDKNNNLILNLTIDIPEKENKDKFIKGRTLGVDVGIKYPAYVCLNDDTYKRTNIGNSLELIKYREQFRSRRQRLQQQISLNKGGRGRKDKLKALDSLKGKERNFAKTYNHNISKSVVKFAKDNKCEYINMEKIESNGLDDKVLGSWGYYELQTMVKYKADREGIQVRFVDPRNTSRRCSCCGSIDKENRQSQDRFVCTSCGFGESHGFKTKDKKIYVNADHNAAINIARSDKFLK